MRTGLKLNTSQSWKEAEVAEKKLKNRDGSSPSIRENDTMYKIESIIQPFISVFKLGTIKY